MIELIPPSKERKSTYDHHYDISNPLHSPPVEDEVEMWLKSHSGGTHEFVFFLFVSEIDKYI